MWRPWEDACIKREAKGKTCSGTIMKGKSALRRGEIVHLVTWFIIAESLGHSVWAMEINGVNNVKHIELEHFLNRKKSKWKFERSPRPRSLWFSPQLVEWWTVSRWRCTRMKSLKLLEVLLMMAWEVHTIQSMFDHPHHQVFLWGYITWHNTKRRVQWFLSSAAVQPSTTVIKCFCSF